MAEYKHLLDQSVELYRLKDKVYKMEETERSLRAEKTRLESHLKKMSDENKKNQCLVKFYEKLRAKENKNRAKQSTEVSHCQ